MDYMDALAAGVSKPKYMLNRLFDLQHFPEDTASTLHNNNNDNLY